MSAEEAQCMYWLNEYLCERVERLLMRAKLWKMLFESRFIFLSGPANHANVFFKPNCVKVLDQQGATCKPLTKSRVHPKSPILVSSDVKWWADWLGSFFHTISLRKITRRIGCSAEYISNDWEMFVAGRRNRLVSFFHTLNLHKIARRMGWMVWNTSTLTKN